ncbi:MAG: SulP family inorganic anion transporter [Burkholderiaceae bacterium]
MSADLAVGPAAGRSRWIDNAYGAFTTALVQIPIEGAFGVIALAPLGPRYAPIGMLSGLFSAVVGTIVAALAGSRRMIGGPRASSTLLIAAECALLAQHPSFRSPDGPDAALILSFLALAVFLSGTLQLLIGYLRLASVAKFIPYPVAAGLSAGMGVLIIAVATRMLLGLPGDVPWSDVRVVWNHVEPGAVAVAVLAFVLLLRSVRLLRWPPALVALSAAAVLHHLLSLAMTPEQLGPTMPVPATPSLGLPLPIALDRLFTEVDPRVVFGLLGPFVLTMAILITLDGIVSSSAVDSALGARRDSNRESIAQGWANAACALVGALPTAGGPPRTLINHEAGGRAQSSIYFYGIFVAAGIVLAPGVLKGVPISAVAGVLAVTGIWMIDDWTRRTAVQIFDRRAVLADGMRRLLTENYLIMVLVAVTNILLGIPSAVLLGMLVSMVMFVRNNSRNVVRAEARGDTRRSIKVRAPAATRCLAAEGQRIALLTLEGAIFFGTADQLARRIRALLSTVDYIILDMRRVTEIDPTGARILLASAGQCHAAGKRLLIAELGASAASDQRLLALESMTTAAARAPIDYEPDVDRALETAEDQLLARIGQLPSPSRPLALGETMLGQGLTADELAFLTSLFLEKQFQAGEYIFRAGDRGDAIYLTTAGEISILLPDGQQGRGKRIASFAPGVVFGELAVLEGLPRSAHAFAEAPLTVLALSADQFAALRRDHPQIAAKLLLNLSRYLSSRMRSLTNELSAALAR